MAFIGKSFIFDGVPSETYDLFLISNGANGVLQNMGSASVSILTQKVHRKPKLYFYSTEQEPIMSFTLTIACEHAITAHDQRAIQRWLLGHSTYKKLQIVQEDYQNIYFNCILSEPMFTTYGNIPFQLQVTVNCDSPFAWEIPKTRRYDDYDNITTIHFLNTSDNNDYTYPLIKFKVGGGIPNVSIKNIDDNMYGFAFTGLSQNEVLTIDSDLCMIKSSLGLNRLDNFTGGFLRLKTGLNRLEVSGGIYGLEITTQSARKVSG